jgi:hypothetical protein
MCDAEDEDGQDQLVFIFDYRREWRRATTFITLV